MKIIRTVLVVAVMLLLGVNVQALTLPHIIGDNMVLQQRTNATLWGWAKAGAVIKVSDSWNKKQVSTTADNKGRWKIQIATPAASYDPQTITVNGDGTKITINNVLIGEVWFCSGQSNMEMPVKGFPSQPIEGSGKTTAYANQYINKIRMVTIPHVRTQEPADSVGGEWKVCNNENVPDFTAIGYYFAESLNKLLDVPIGIIHDSWGGSLVEEWMPAEVIAQFNNIMHDKIKQAGHETVTIYNGMVHPLLNYTIKGFLWNQGESQAIFGDKNYPEHFTAFLKSWREKFNQGNLPMYCVEIPGFNYDGPNGLMAPPVREQQWQGAEQAGNCEMVCIIDLMHPWQGNDIHGSIKQPIGERLAFMAAGKTYGMKNMPCEYPRYQSVELKGDKALLHFKNAAGGLTPNTDLKGFEVAGENKVFYPANANEDFGSATVTVTCPNVNDIKAVRYCYHNWAVGQVFNSQWLPLVPFRTDNW